MQLTNFEQTGLTEVKNWIKRQEITELKEDTLREALKTVNISFAAENINRLQSTLLCELKDSYVQQSQRYVDLKESAYNLPQLEPEVKKEAQNLIDKAFSLYREMSELKSETSSGRPQKEDYKYGIPIEDARYILPLAVTTNIKVAMTGNKLYDLFKLLFNEKYGRLFSEFRTKLKKKLPACLIKLLPTNYDNKEESLVDDLYQSKFAQLNSNHNMILLSAFKDLDLKVGLGAATSTSSLPPSDKLDDWGDKAVNKARSLAKRVLGYGHESISEQARTTFGMMCSLVTYHQQIRHRLSENHREDLTQLLTATEREVLVPPTIEQSKFETQFLKLVKEIKQFRNQLLADYSSEQVLPFLLNCEQIKLIISTNARIDNQMLAERICRNAQWEIRQLATKKLEKLRQLSPVLYEQALPTCVYDQCEEGALSCGQQQSVRKKWRGDKENG